MDFSGTLAVGGTTIQPVTGSYDITPDGSSWLGFMLIPKGDPNAMSLMGHTVELTTNAGQKTHLIVEQLEPLSGECQFHGAGPPPG